MKFEVSKGESKTDVILNKELTSAILGKNEQDVEIVDRTSEKIILRIGDAFHTITSFDVKGLDVSFKLNGNRFSYNVKNEQEVRLEEMGFSAMADAGEGILNAPMPGKILSIMVKEGENVELGQPIVILEAMKMENELKAPVAGTVAQIHVEQEQNVEKNEPIIEIEDLG